MIISMQSDPTESSDIDAMNAFGSAGTIEIFDPIKAIIDLSNAHEIDSMVES